MYKGFRGARCGFEDTAEDDIRTVADAACHAAGDVINLAAFLRYAAEARTVLKALAGIDAHDGKRQLSLQFVEDRFARTDRQATDAALDDSADGIPFAAHGFNQFIKLSRVGFRADLNQAGVNSNTLGSQFLLGNTARDDTRRRLTC